MMPSPQSCPTCGSLRPCLCPARDRIPLECPVSEGLRKSQGPRITGSLPSVPESLPELTIIAHDVTSQVNTTKTTLPKPRVSAITIARDQSRQAENADLRNDVNSSSFESKSNNRSTSSTIMNADRLLDYPDKEFDDIALKSESELPHVNLLSLLIDVFFNHYLYFGRMFERSPAEMKSSLHLPLSHPDRPHSILLHAICGAASIYANKIAPTTLAENGKGFCVQSGLTLPDSFGERHCRIAAKRLHTYGRTSTVQSEIQIVQAMVILSTTFRRLGKLPLAYGTMDGALRRASLIHLNVGPGFEGFTPDYIPNMRVSAAVSPKQEEARRNIFWMCYVNERYHAQFLAQAMITVDEDISQALPTRGDLFDQGVTTPHSERQYIHTTNLLFVHPPALTDSFGLYVKSAILLSRVITFNRRFRTLNFLEVPGLCAKKSDSQGHDTSNTNNTCPKITPDAREVDKFLELENVVESFTRCFPPYLREPITQDGSVDWLLLNAYLASYSAKMHLHDPHADLTLNLSENDTRDFACPSACKVAEALDDAYHLLRSMAESIPDVSLSDPFCSSILFRCSSFCVEIIQKSTPMPPTSEEDIIAVPRCRKFWEKFDYMRTVLKRIGARLPFADLLTLMLDTMVLRLMSPKRASHTSVE